MLKIFVYLNLCITCVTADEEGDQTTGINVLADLLPRCDNEQEYLLRWLQSPEAKGLTLRMKNMTLVELKVQPYIILTNTHKSSSGRRSVMTCWTSSGSSKLWVFLSDIRYYSDCNA